jgi:hypothetical protein
MRLERRRTWWLVLLVSAVLGLGLAPTLGEAVSFDLTVEFSGATAPSGSPPWGTITFTDLGLGIVQVEFEANLQSSTEFISEWSFNLDPSFDPNNLLFAFISGNDADVIATGADAFQADGDGKFDVQFEWTGSSAGDRLDGTETSVYSITCTLCSGFNASSFDFTSATGGGQGVFHTAAHVQGIGPSAGLSGWVGDGGTGGEGGIGGEQVPAPATLVFLGLGLVGLGARQAIRRLRQRA